MAFNRVIRCICYIINCCSNCQQQAKIKYPELVLWQWRRCWRGGLQGPVLRSGHG
uniref:Uncharacterized protein n=1 Tax=Helianthus annuus TaxID=4232 RepID=A0A251TN99_HELAN